MQPTKYRSFLVRSMRGSKYALDGLFMCISTSFDAELFREIEWTCGQHVSETAMHSQQLVTAAHQ
jgi:hypothetical protein